MKVWIDNKVYDPEDHMIAVHLEKQDKINISKMFKQCSIYASFPKSMSIENVDNIISDFKDYLDNLKESESNEN